MACLPSICTMSLGRCFAGHALHTKLRLARDHGFKGIELFYEDLVDVAVRVFGSDSKPCQLRAARYTRKLCEDLGLTILCLQPFMHFEGHKDRFRQQRNMQELLFWVHLVHALGTDLIIFPSNFLGPDMASTDFNVIVEDMREAADLGLQSQPVVRFAYEALCWGTAVDSWEASWEVVRAVNRPNFGICLDAFNIAGRLWADPLVQGGLRKGCRRALHRSLHNMVRYLAVNKVFLVQLADAERLKSPLDETHAFYNKEQPCRMSWSRNARLFYGESERGAYLPIKKIMTTIVHAVGYRGWISLEVFSRHLAETGRDVPYEMAQRAEDSWKRMAEDLHLDLVEKPAARPRGLGIDFTPAML